MNRTTRRNDCNWYMIELTLRALRRSGLDGDALLLEALLRRGFLVYRDDESIFLARGSHTLDVEILGGIVGLRVTPCDNGMAVGRVTAHGDVERIAEAIVRLPGGSAGFVGRGWHFGWQDYRKLVWGNKAPVCPPRCPGLDIGVALLVKTLPLMRVATWNSCDGHGEGPLYIDLVDEYHAGWLRQILKFAHTNQPDVLWEVGWRRLEVSGQPEALLADVQRVARGFLDRPLIEAVGAARRDVLRELGEREPSLRDFEDCAQRHIHEHVSRLRYEQLRELELENVRLKRTLLEREHEIDRLKRAVAMRGE